MESPHSSNKVVPAEPSDVDELMAVQFEDSAGDEFTTAIWGTNTAENRQRAGARLLQKWREHPDTMHVMKCVDASSGELMSFCVWEVVPTKASREEALQPDCMDDCSWLEGRAKEKARAFLSPGLVTRWDLLHGKPHAHLTNMTTRPEMRRRGAASALVKWGLNLANDLRIPALAETSDMSYKLYQSLGMKEVATVTAYLDGKPLESCAMVMKEPDQPKPT